MARKQHFTLDDMWFVGEDKQLQFTILNEAGVAVDITGWAITFALATLPDATPIFSKTVGSGIAIAGGSGGVLTVTVADSDTDALEPGAYVYALKRTDANTETVLAFGDVILQQAAAV